MSQSPVPKPDPFLTIRLHRKDDAPSLLGACVGYELGTWRSAQLADHIFEWLPEFALTPSEWNAMHHANAVARLRRAAHSVYQSGKFERRGEFGELLLHILIRQVFDSLPAISKIYYKSAPNDPVKGFDAVHVVGPPNDLELWLGEAKFYDDASAAIRDAVEELESHLGTNYLRNEFMLIAGKIDDAWPHAPILRRLLSRNTSLDEVFKRACIPVLLTYDSQCLANHKAVTEQYVADFQRELLRHHKAFAGKLQAALVPKEVRVHLFLLPLNTKQALQAELDRKLKAWQQL